MLESSPVSFFFNQGEYEASVVTSHEGYVYCLSDDEQTLLRITLASDFGVSRIETVNASELTADTKIWKAVRGKETRKWCLGSPPLPRYEVKLKNGRIAKAQPRGTAYNAIEWIEQWMGKDKLIPQDMVAGWREKKS